VPNTSGIFISGVGSQTISSIAYTRTLATRQGDIVQGHYHNQTNDSLVVRGSIGGAGSSSVALFGTTAQLVGYTQQVQSPATDGTNGTPRTGSETRPANIAFNHIIKI
jgi:hypothetical protein